MIKNVNQISEQAFLLDFGNEITKEINQNVLNTFYYISKNMQKDNFLGLKNCVPSYNKLLIHFHPSKKNKEEIINFINSIKISKFKSKKDVEELEIPVCYDEEFALDIQNVSKKTKINEDRIIKSHLSTKFFVYMIGFMPGLPFMGDLESNLNVSRLTTPRLRVPSGSVGIVEKFCVIYPNESPGGWNIIGRTPIKLFFKDKNKPTHLNPGSQIKIRKISKKEFFELQKIDE